MKHGYLLVLAILFSSSGCVPFHSEAALSVSWGDNQRISRNSASDVSHGIEPAELTDAVYEREAPQPELPKAHRRIEKSENEAIEDRALFKREIGKSNLYLVPVLPADPDDSL